MASDMIRSANGIGSDFVNPVSDDPKGIGNETTLDHNVSSKEELYGYLLALSENVTLRLRKQKKYANVVVVTLKDKFFRRKSHQKKLVNATNITEEVYKASKEILNEMDTDEGIRLIGVRLDNLVSNSNHQTSLFESLEVRDDNKNLEEAVDNIKEKYGFKAIKKASLISKKVGNKYLNK